MTRLDTDLARGFEAPPIKTGGQARAEQLKIQGAENDLVLDRQTIAANEQKLRSNEAVANEAQRKQQGVAKLSELLAAHSSVDEQGKRKVDHSAILKGLAAGGFGDTALAYDTTRRADELSEVNNHLKELELADRKHDSLAKILNGVMKNGTEDGYHRGIGSALAEGLIKPDQAQQLFQQGWNDQTKAELAQLIDQSKTLKEDSDLYTASLDQKKKALLLPFDVQEAALKAAKTNQEVTGTVPITEYQKEQLADTDASRAQQASEGQKNRDVQVRGQNMTDARSREANGAAGTKLEQGAVKSIAEMETGIAELKRLKTEINAHAGDMGIKGRIGTAPVVGPILQAMGYTGPATLDSKIALARQVVGKAKEGGVLRKEDEEKYKQILANIGDQPDVAFKKIDGVVSEIEDQLKQFKETQQQAGRRPLSGAEQQIQAKKGGGPKVGDVVNVGGKRVKIKVLHGDGSFDGDEVK